MVKFIKLVVNNPWIISISERVISLLSKAIIYILIARLLGPESQGICGLFNSYSGIAAVIFVLGIDIANTYFTSQNLGSEIDNYLISNSILYFIFSVIISILFFFSSSSLLKIIKFPPEYFLLLILSVNVTIIRQLFRGFIYGKGYFLQQFYGVLISDFFLLLFVLILAVLKKFDIGNFLIVQISLSFLSLIYWLKVLLDKNKFIFRYNYEIFKKTLKYSFKVFFTNILMSFNLRINVFLVAYFMSMEFLGYYTIAITISEIVLNLPLSVTNVILNQNTRNESVDLSKFGIINFFMFSIVIIVSLFASYLIPLIYGPRFIVSITPLVILLFACYFLSIGSILSYVLLAQNKGHLTLISSIPTLITTFLFSIYLIPKFGLVGASISSFLSFFLFAVLQIFSISRNTKIENMLSIVIPNPKKSINYLISFYK